MIPSARRLCQEKFWSPRTIQGQANGAVFHPNDWEAIRLTRTADGIYILGNPSDPGPVRIWGLTPVITSRETENTGIVGDFRLGADLRVRSGITISISDSHGDYFEEGVLTLKATMRVAFPAYRENAFCSITGI